MQMARGRPYQDLTELLRFADLKFRSLTRKDWLEAFIHIPDASEIVKKHQKGMPAGAVISPSGEDLSRLVDRFERMLVKYHRKFGHKFIPLDENASFEILVTEIANRYRNGTQDEMEIVCNNRRRVSLRQLASMMADYRPQEGDGVTIDAAFPGQKLPQIKEEEASSAPEGTEVPVPVHRRVSS